MNVDLGIWGKLTRLTYLLLGVAGVIAAIATLCVWYLPVIQQNERIRKKVFQIDAEIQKEAETSKQLNSAIHALSNDPKTVERLARETLNYAKPGETVVRFVPPGTNAPAPTR